MQQGKEIYSISWPHNCKGIRLHQLIVATLNCILKICNLKGKGKLKRSTNGDVINKE